MANSLSNASPETQAAAGVGHNSGELTKETFMMHVYNIERHRNGPLALAKAALKVQVKREKELKALAKVDNIRLKQLEATLYLRALEDEDEAIEIAQTQNQYNVWAELSEGAQGDLFEGLTATPSEREDRWFKMGFKDIRTGRLDPQGHTAADGTVSAGAIFPHIRPSYVPAENYTSWAEGAYEADELNMQDAVRILGRNADTPVEQAAAAPTPEPEETKATVDSEFAETSE